MAKYGVRLAHNQIKAELMGFENPKDWSDRADLVIHFKNSKEAISFASDLLKKAIEQDNEGLGDGWVNIQLDGAIEIDKEIT